MQKNPLFPILIVDDEPNALVSLKAALHVAGFTNTIQCEDPLKALEMTAKNNAEIILLDLEMPGKSGHEVMKDILLEFPDTIIIVETGYNEVETAVECMKMGAFDYLVKPIDKNRLTASVARAINIRELQRENTLMKQFLLDEAFEKHEAFSSIITRSSKMHVIFQYCKAIAPSSRGVLITGETGSGKELFAKAVHDLSERKGKFVPVNLAGVDSGVFTDTLFGHVKGAFTGADHLRKGLVEKAAGGTIFFDEIGDLAIDAQVKLLRLLQEREYTPLGSDVSKITDARVIVATHADLEALVESGKFRKDLYYRLKTHHIHLAPLRKRLEDIELLLDYFLESAALELGRNKPSYSNELIMFLKTYHFPGNIREFRGLVYDALSRNKSHKELSIESFREKLGSMPEETKKHRPVDPMPARDSGGGILFPGDFPTVKDAGNFLVSEALKRSRNNQSVAAQMLGISQQALSKRLKKLRQEKNS